MLSIMDTTRLTKLLAMTGSSFDQEALAALRKAQGVVIESGGSWTAMMQNLGRGNGSERGNAALLNEISRLRTENRRLHDELKQARAAKLKRSRATIAVEMHKMFGDPTLAQLSDRELARRTGLSPQTVGNWRRRLRP
jgi:transposase-like protein